jgi:cupin fold WbuC family metalloprotein
MRTFKSKDGSRRTHVLYNVYDDAENPKERIDLTTEADPLQASVCRVPRGRYVAPHRHANHHREHHLSQEAWVVMEGSGVVDLYDIDGTLLETIELVHGDVLVTFLGGHALRSDNLVMLEFKNGPYLNVKTPLPNVQN